MAGLVSHPETLKDYIGTEFEPSDWLEAVKIELINLLIVQLWLSNHSC